MREFAISLTLICLLPRYAYPQFIQKGYVLEMSSSKKPLQSVQIKAAGAPSTASDSYGNFVLKFKDKKAGDPLFFERISRSSYEVINEDYLYNFSLSSKLPVKIVMALRGSVDKMKMEYYRVSTDNITKQFQLELRKLKKDGKLNQSVLDSLNDAMSKLMANAEQLSKKFAYLNTDDISDIERRALKLFLKNNIDSALLLLEGNKTIEKLTNIKRDIETLKTEETKHLKALTLQADLSFLANNADTGFYLYEKLMSFDSLNEVYPYQLGNYLHSYNRFEKSLELFEKALKLSVRKKNYFMSFLIQKSKFKVLIELERISEGEEVLRAIINNFKSIRFLDSNAYYFHYLEILHFKAELFSEQGKYKESEDILLSSLNIINARNWSVQDSLSLLAPFYREVAVVFEKRNNFKLALEYFNKSLAICYSTDKRLPHSIFIARLLVDKGSLFQNFRKFDSARKCFEIGLEMYRKLIVTNPDIIESFARGLDNYGNLLISSREFESAIANFKEALSIRKTLEDDVGPFYQKEIAQILSNMGAAYAEIHYSDTALIYFHAALAIRQNMFESNIEHKFHLSRCYNNIAAIYIKVDELVDSAVYYNEKALDIRVQLVKYDTIAYATFLIRSLFTKAHGLSKRNQFDQIDGIVNDIISLSRRLYRYDPENFCYEIAHNLVYCAQLYKDKNLMSNCESCNSIGKELFNEAMSIKALNKIQFSAAENELITDLRVFFFRSH
jgi:tetratricopeptide (TPR) repeat protein